MKQISKGDLVTLVTDRYANLPKTKVGIVTSVRDHLVNVTFPQGSWAFPTWELKPLTKEDSCK